MPAKEVERRIRRVIELDDAGASQAIIAREIGCSKNDVPRYLCLARRESRGDRKFPPGKVSIAEFARRSGFAEATVSDAINRGVLKAERGSTSFLIDEAQLDSLPKCRYGGCDAPALGKVGGCQLHAHALAAIGKPRPPEVRARISAGASPRSPEFRAKVSRALKGIARPYVSDWMRECWRRTGDGPVMKLIDRPHIGGRARQVYKGRWAGRKAGALGGRPRGYTDEQADQVRELKQKHKSWGRVTLAQATGLTEDQVRYVLGKMPGENPL